MEVISLHLAKFVVKEKAPTLPTVFKVIKISTILQKSGPPLRFLPLFTPRNMKVKRNTKFDVPEDSILNIRSLCLVAYITLK